MMTVYPEIRLDGAAELARSIDRVEKAIGRGTNRLGQTIAKEGLRIVVKLTPRARNRSRAASSKRGHEALFKQWEIVETISRGSAYRAVIQNKARLDNNFQGGLGLMLALEFGARPHAIPAGGLLTMMSWLQPRQVQLFAGSSRSGGSPRRGGGVITESFTRRRQKRMTVFTMKVKNHPGNRPFKMVSRARRQLQVTAGFMLRAFGKQLAAEYAGLSVVVGAPTR